jgi:hypothetical protein
MRKDTANTNVQSGGGGDKLSSQVDSNDKKWPNDDVAAGINKPKTDSSRNSHSVVLQPKVAPPPASGTDLAKDLASQSSPPRETMVIESKGPDKDFGNNLTDCNCKGHSWNWILVLIWLIIHLTADKSLLKQTDESHEAEEDDGSLSVDTKLGNPKFDEKAIQRALLVMVGLAGVLIIYFGANFVL